MYPFKEGDFAPRNGWYVAAFCEDIGEALLSRWILGQPVVLYRKADGTAVAVGGRCPHRYYPLGESLRVGDAIQCGYHGITFGADGRCTRVPSQDTVPGVYRIPSYPLVERGLWAFIWMGDPELADEALIPSEADMGFGLDGYIYKPFSTLHVEGRYQLLNDNLLDLTHLGFLHASSIGSEENASAPEERHVSERKVVSRRWLRGAACPPLMAKNTGYAGPIDRLAGMTFFAPGFHAGLDDTYVVAGDPERGGECLQSVKVFHAVTPATRHETNYFFALGGTSEAQVEALKIALPPVLDEDAFATVEIEKILTRCETLLPELMLKSDGTAVEGRRILQRMMDAERALA
jgi:phenylpropionate dioxygenase-like ring-hydroxylating dioxygenase large terminal subunit